MADEKEKKEENAEEPKKQKSKIMLWLIVGVVVLAAAGGGYFFATKGNTPAAQAAEGAAPAAAEPAGLVALDTFLVNLNDSTGDRYMKLTLRLTVSPESGADKINTDDLVLAKIRDRVLTVLTGKTFMDLSHPLGKESLRREIQTQLQPLMDQAQIQEVLFSEFVVQ